MPKNETFIMLGLAAAGLLLLRNRGGTEEEEEVDQLTGTAMMASGEGTAPNAPFVPFSLPSDPVFFFNQGGEMSKVTDAPVPAAALFGEDIGLHPIDSNRPELLFTVDQSDPPAGTSDPSPTTPEFEGAPRGAVVPSTVWNDESAIAAANEMPILAIQDVGTSITILGSSVDIATLSSKEQFRALNVDSGFAFTTTGSVLSEYVKGFIPPAPASPAIATTGSGTDPSAVDEDRGVYPGGGNPSELEFNVALTGVPTGTTDISPATPEFASSFDMGVFYPDFFVPAPATPRSAPAWTAGLIGVNTEAPGFGGFDVEDPW
jgi:hypothetical protein|tara:strand:+ start:1930 stop:2883 length:954 start_codon:yes stop_codon:yes gene_type:complete